MTSVTAAVLAHQGGWDEILFVLTPLAVFAGLLALARKRAGELDGNGADDVSHDPEVVGTDAGGHATADPGQG